MLHFVQPSHLQHAVEEINVRFTLNDRLAMIAQKQDDGQTNSKRKHSEICNRQLKQEYINVRQSADQMYL